MSSSLFQVTAALEVTKKRRIYDITNVMEGCALIKKVGKNMYKWQGKTCHGRTCDALSEDDDRLDSAREDQKQLEDEEKELTEYESTQSRELQI